LGDGYAEKNRKQLQEVEDMVPSDIFVFVGASEEWGHLGGEAMALAGGNMKNGDIYVGGLGAVAYEPLGIAGGVEATSSDGFTPIVIFDVGYVGGYSSDDGRGFILSTPTPIFVGFGFGWSRH